MSEPIRGNDPSQEVELPWTARDSCGLQTGTMVWVVRPFPGAGHASHDHHSSAGHEEDVKPDLLIDPPDHNPDHPPEPPDSADR